MKRTLVGAWLVSMLLVWVPAVSAQIEQGRLSGNVKDAQGGVLPGVTVTATSPALIGSRAAVTETDGQFLLANLPSGVYTLRFELPGFQTVLRENIRLSQGSTLSVDIDLQVATLAETITVTGESPVVDTTSTKVGSEFNSETLAGVPSATDLWASLAQTPGVRMRGYDVGGSHKSQQNGYEAFGIRGQNKVMFEGIDTTEGDNAAFFYSQYFAVDEVSVTAVGGDVEMSSPGTAIVQTYKSGGNNFSGTEHFTYEGKNFVDNNTSDELSARGFTGNPNLLFYEIHLDLGGPIIKDKLWFYAAYNFFKLDKALSGVDPAVATDPVSIEDPLVKATWKLTGNDTVTFFYQPRNLKLKPNRGLSAATAPESVLGQASKTWIKKVSWNRVWSNRLFMDARAAACCEIWPMVTRVDAGIRPPRQDSTGLITGAGWDAFTLDYQKPQFSTTWTYFLPDKAGSHDMKFGFEWIENRYQQGINGQSGQARYLDLNGGIDRVLLNDTGRFDEFGETWEPSFTSNRMFAGFLQDRWSPVRNITLQLGVRWGYQRPYFEEGTRNPVLSDVFPDLTLPEKVLFTRNNFAPRLGFVWDLFGNGRTAFKTSYGRYYAIYANNFNTANPGGVNTRTFRFLDANGNRVFDGPQELGALLASTGGSSTVVDPDMKQPYADEYSASLEHQFWGEASVRGVYVRKMTKNVFGLVNAARLGTIDVPVRVPNPLSPGQFINALDTSTTAIDNRFMTIPDAGADYDSISLSAQKRFARGLFVQGSFDYQWRDELRQPATANVSTSPLDTDPIGIYSFGGTFPLDYSADVPNRQQNTNWQYRLLARYEFPRSIAAAFNYRVQSGFPYSSIVPVSLPNAGTQNVFVDDLDNQYSDAVHIFDIRVDKSIEIAGVKLTGILDVYNLLNSNTVTNFFLISGTTFNRVIAALDPRAVQIAGRITF
jgi:hypothetical protein